jgi:hypothetical protein
MHTTRRSQHETRNTQHAKIEGEGIKRNRNQRGGMPANERWSIKQRTIQQTHNIIFQHNRNIYIVE